MGEMRFWHQFTEHLGGAAGIDEIVHHQPAAAIANNRGRLDDCGLVRLLRIVIVGSVADHTHRFDKPYVERGRRSPPAPIPRALQPPSPSTGQVPGGARREPWHPGANSSQLTETFAGLGVAVMDISVGLLGGDVDPSRGRGDLSRNHVRLPAARRRAPSAAAGAIALHRQVIGALLGMPGAGTGYCDRA
jgi:hypothetical protein